MNAFRDVMTRIDTATAVMLVSVVLFTLVAAISDLRTRRIPNRLTIPMCLAGLVYQLAFFRLDGLVTALAGFSAGFGVFFILWMIGTAGGGDVKLMGALGPWLGGWMMLKVMFISLLFVTIGTAGIILTSLIRRGLRRTKAQYLKAATDRRTGETVARRQQRRVMAFAAPVALATWCALAFQLLQQVRQ